MFTMAPPPVFSIEMTPYFMPKNTPFRLTACSWSQQFSRLFVERRHLTAEAGIVDEDVQPAELLLGGSDHLSNVVFNGDIGMNGNRRSADFGGDDILIAADIGAHNLGAFGRK